MARVAVLLVTRDRPDMLPLAVESICRQRFADFTLYIVDDGSEQLPAAVADHRVVCESGPHLGMAGVRNRALELWRRGGEEYACWMDDDDYSHPDRLGVQVACLDSDPTLDLVSTDLLFCGFRDSELDAIREGTFTDGTRRSIDPSRYDHDIIGRGWHDNTNHPTLMMRRTVLDRPGYLPEFEPVGCDYPWHFELFRSGCVFGHVPEVLYYYRTHDGNVSNPARRRAREQWKPAFEEMRRRYAHE